jgi:hypothetical protein
LVKIDLTTLNAVDFTPNIDPGFGQAMFGGGYIGFQYQIIDACDKYLYLIFAYGFLSSYYRIFKIDIQTMELVKYAEFPHYGYGDITAGAADMQWIYLMHPGQLFITIIPADLDITQYTTVHAAPPNQGAFIGPQPGGGRGIKVDPVTDLLYITGGAAAGAITIEDLSVVAHWYPDTEGILTGGNAWSSNLLWSRRYGIGYQHQSYHPFSPRFYVFPGSGYEHEVRTSNACVGSADWVDCGYFFQAYCSFFGYTPYEHHGINKLSFGQTNVGDWYVQTFDGVNPKLPGIELAADKRRCKPVLKSIDNYGASPSPDPLGTFLTRLNVNLGVEEYRHFVLGEKELVLPTPLHLLEPQIWDLPNYQHVRGLR